MNITRETLKPIGFFLIGLFFLGMMYVIWSILHGGKIESLTPYIVGSVFSALIGAGLYYSKK